jgi:hypothetical protein
MKLAVLVSALCLALLVAPVAAKVWVRHDTAVEFSNYRTYAWQGGTPAAREDVQQFIVDAIDQELQSKGFQRVDAGPADLYVVSQAVGETWISSGTNFYTPPSGMVRITTVDPHGVTDGTWIVDLVDARSGVKVWTAEATEGFETEAKATKIRKKIDGLAKKMFKNFPPK